MPGPGEIVVLLVIGVIAALLLARILVVVPGWLRRARRPETRAIRVIGVGGGGSNAVDRMVAAKTQGVGFAACNTDAQALRRSSAETRIRIGDAITGGLGSGGDPDIGRRAAEEDAERIGRAVAGADLVFVTAGLGGGTGSGAAPIVAAKARELGALTIAVVTKPFAFEGSQRKRVADTAAAELGSNVDALIVVPNDRVGDVLAEDTSMLDAFRVVDDVLRLAVEGVIDLVTAPGLINLDFADIETVMKDAGPALIGLGRGSGEHRATDAARQAITSPLLEASIDGARGILFNISGPADLRLSEVRQAADEIRERADVDANVIFGTSLNRSLGDDVLVTLIATGLTGRGSERAAASPAETTPAAEAAMPAETQPLADAMPPPGEPQPLAEAATPPAEMQPLAEAMTPVEVASPPAEPPPAEPPAETPPAEPPPAPPPPAVPPPRPKQPARAIKARSAVDTVPAPAEIVDRGQPPPGPTDKPDIPAMPDEFDLEVPSFLRRRGRRDS